MTDYQIILNEIMEGAALESPFGSLASYIPELENVEPDKLGVHLHCLNGHHFGYGDHEEKFSIQSISKVFGLTMAYRLRSEKIWQRLGVEPSGNPFNSLVQLEYENGIPRNPFINAGALVISDILLSELENPIQDLLDFVRMLAGHNNIEYDKAVIASEREHSWRNAALVNLMKSFGNIENSIDDVLNFYIHQCSMSMSCKELSHSFLLFASHGLLPYSDERILSHSQTKRINAVMQSCGFYDEAGEFAFRVGLPGKSGVGGGIVAVHPGKYSVAVWSPRLNKHGNSHLGMKILEEFTTKSTHSIF